MTAKLGVAFTRWQYSYIAPVKFCLALYQNASSNSAADNSMFVLLLRDCFDDGTKVKVTSAERETALLCTWSRIERVDQETSRMRRTLEDTVGTMLCHYYFWNTRVRVRGD